jgi:6-phosphogluconolactonase
MAVRLRRFDDAAALRAALVQRLGAAIPARADASPCAVMLSGGSTPLPAYRALASRVLGDASACRVFLSDERYMPSDAEGSNFRAAKPLLDALRAAGAEVLRVPTELPLQQAASQYESALAALLDGGTILRLGVLGLGADGHTASLFTARDLEAGSGRLAIAVHRPDARDGISVTPALLRAFDDLVFVVEGEAKRDALAELLRPDGAVTAARAVAGCRSVEAWADAAAARGLA